MTAGVLSLALGCAPRDIPAAADETVSDQPPDIEALSLECDVDSAEWSLSAQTSGWSGGGTLWMARDAASYEAHAVYSESAAADGTSDQLGLDLSIVGDWKDAVSGSSTVYFCSDEAELSFLFTVLDRAGEAVWDCRTWGAQPDLWAGVDGATACETLLE